MKCSSPQRPSVCAVEGGELLPLVSVLDVWVQGVIGRAGVLARKHARLGCSGRDNAPTVLFPPESALHYLLGSTDKPILTSRARAPGLRG